LRCVDELPPERQAVLDHYFGQRLNMVQIGEKLHRSAGAVNQLLVRLRTALRECVRRRLSAEESL
jgi:DNA-directed RNA polymerase specialized sigma24 family protein